MQRSMTSQELHAARMRYMDSSKILLGDIVLIYGKMSMRGDIEPELFHQFLYHLDALRTQLHTVEMDIVREFYHQQYTQMLPALPAPSTETWHGGPGQATQPMPRASATPNRNTTGRLRTVRLNPLDRK